MEWRADPDSRCKPFSGSLQIPSWWGYNHSDGPQRLIPAAARASTRRFTARMPADASIHDRPVLSPMCAVSLPGVREI